MIRRNKMCDIKTGDKVIIIKEGTHKYEVGETVYLIQDFGESHNQAATGYQPNSKVDGCCFVYRNEVEKVTSNEEATPVKQTFTKKDLKTGHRLILEDGEVAIVFMDSDIQTNPAYSRDWVKYINRSNGFDDLAYWNDDLNPEGDRWVSRVVKVVKPKYSQDVFKLECEVDIIWEREAPKSKEQIAYEEAVEASEKAREAYELAQKKLEALNQSKS